VAVVVPVEICGLAFEQRLEALELVAKHGDRRLALPRARPRRIDQLGWKLEVEADLHAGRKHGLGIDPAAGHHRAHRVHGVGSSGLHDPPVVGLSVAVVVGGDDQRPGITHARTIASPRPGALSPSLRKQPLHSDKRYAGILYRGPMPCVPSHRKIGAAVRMPHGRGRLTAT